MNNWGKDWKLFQYWSLG